MRKEKRNWTTVRFWAGVIVAALVTAIVLFVVLLQLEKNVLTQYEKGEIYVAVKQIPKGQRVTQDNWRDFLEIKQLDKSCIPRTAINSEGQIRNLTAGFDIEAGVSLTRGMLEPGK